MPTKSLLTESIPPPIITPVVQYRGETKFNVAQLLRESVGAIRSYQIQPEVEIRQGEEVTFTGQLELLRTDKGILTRANLKSSILETCSRCLTSFNSTLSVEFQEEFYPTIEVNLGYKLPPPEDSSAFTVDENHILDIKEAVRQYTEMALPLKPLCKPDCAGLCSQCGKNFNEGICQCPPLPTDPRWMALKDLEITK